VGTFLVNADVLRAFGVNDLETSEHLSRLTSEATIAVENENTSSNPCVSDQWR
jgi:type IV secretory pathway TraG/TraD family ATPase VirD4